MTAQNAVALVRKRSKQIQHLLDLTLEELSKCKINWKDVDEYTKKEWKKDFAKLSVAKLPFKYENLTWTQAKGVKTIGGILNPNGMETTGKKSCQINLWSGMPDFTLDRKILNDENIHNR